MTDYSTELPSTPALQLYALFRAHAQKGRPGWNWVVFNGDANVFVLHLIRSGIPFTEDDIRYFIGFHHRDWLPLESFHESAYAAACTSRNDATRKALETVLCRKPFIIWTIAGSVDQYLAIGDFFFWQGERVLIDSFNDKAGRINVSVRDRRCDVAARYLRITHDDFRAAFPKPARARKPKQAPATEEING